MCTCTNIVVDKPYTVRQFACILKLALNFLFWALRFLMYFIAPETVKLHPPNRILAATTLFKHHMAASFLVPAALSNKITHFPVPSQLFSFCSHKPSQHTTIRSISCLKRHKKRKRTKVIFALHFLKVYCKMLTSDWLEHVREL